MSSAQARGQKRNRDRGLCGCGKPPTPGTSKCQRCRDLQNAAIQRKRQWRRDNGCCCCCDEPRLPESSCFCQKHYDERQTPEYKLAQARRREALKAEAFKVLLGDAPVKCHCEGCVLTHPLLLGFDHLGNDGRNHSRPDRGSGRTAKKVIKDPVWGRANLVVRCHACNLGRHLNGGGYCPQHGCP